MLRMIIRRLLSSVPVLAVVTFLSFLLVSLLPGDPAGTILGPTASQEQYQQLDRQLGLDRPLWTQYSEWVGNALHGDFGASLVTGEPVAKVLTSRTPVTMSLVIGATLLATLVGIALGVASGRRVGRGGGALNVLSLLGSSLPNFWLGLGLVALFAVTVPVFPATGYVDLLEDPGLWVRSLILPWVALAAGGSALIAKQTRDAMADTLAKDFVRVLLANGFSRRSILYRHALRNAAIPITTTVGIVFVGLLSGSVLIEAVFAMPGLGSATVTAAGQHDLPVLQGGVVYFTLLVILVNLLVDIAYGLLNPRVRVT